jgi:hypothetical protein
VPSTVILQCNTDALHTRNQSIYIRMKSGTALYASSCMLEVAKADPDPVFSQTKLMREQYGDILR